MEAKGRRGGVLRGPSPCWSDEVRGDSGGGELGREDLSCSSEKVSAGGLWLGLPPAREPGIPQARLCVEGALPPCGGFSLEGALSVQAL